MSASIGDNPTCPTPVFEMRGSIFLQASVRHDNDRIPQPPDISTTPRLTPLTVKQGFLHLAGLA